MELSVKDVHVTLDHAEIVKGVSLNVHDKQNVGIIGPNGCGKSTLLKAIYRVNPVFKGTITLNSENLIEMHAKEAARKIAVVGQFNELSFDFTVYEMVLMGRSPHKKFMESMTHEDYQKADEALEKTDLTSLKDRSYLSLSGGEKQRVILARALVQDPELLILDEPTNHLDIRFQYDVLNLVHSLHISTLSVLHNLEFSAKYCDYLYAMKDGKIINEGTPEQLITPDTIHKLYSINSAIYTNPITSELAIAYLG